MFIQHLHDLMEVSELLVPLLLSSLVLTIFLSIQFKSCKPTPNLPPGPCKVPLIGNLHNLLGALPHHALHDLAHRYGKLMHLQLGELSVFVVSSADIAKQVMQAHDVNFASRPSLLISEIFLYDNKDIAFAPHGEYWRQLKKMCVLELLSNKRVQSFRFIREQVFTGLMNWIASNEGSPVCLMKRFYYSNFEIVSRSAVGSVTKEIDLLISIFTAVLELGSGVDIVDLFPSIGLLRRFSRSRQMIEKYHDELDIILEKIIQEHRVANRKAADEKETHEDLLDILLKHQEKDSEFPLSTDNIKAVLADVLLGGSASVSTIAIWAIAEMMKSPRILNKAQQEVRQIYEAKGYVDESDIDQLKYLKLVIKETLRLHPPAPLLLPRKCIQNCKINGYEIVVGNNVIINAWGINRDPTYWNNPDCFLPERFSNSTVDYGGTNLEYIPFGAGRRMCPGINSGIANIQLPLAMLLYHFDWKLPTGMKPEDIDMTEAFGLAASKKQPLCVVPILRRALPHSTK